MFYALAKHARSMGDGKPGHTTGFHLHPEGVRMSYRESFMNAEGWSVADVDLTAWVIYQGMHGAVDNMGLETPEQFEFLERYARSLATRAG